jgi:membrane protease YdiL (CAAX protease family)
MSKRTNGLKTSVAVLLLIGVYVGLPLLILADVIPFSMKFVVLALGAIGMYGATRLIGISNTDLGLTTKDTVKSLRDVTLITSILLVVGLAIWISGWHRIAQVETWQFYLFYVFISCPAQEFLYRGAATALLQRFWSNPWFVMIASSALFAFVHIIYRDLLTVALMFAIGLVWFVCYRRTKNLIGVILSHAVLGVVTIVSGFIN